MTIWAENEDACLAGSNGLLRAQALGLFFTPESPVWLEWKGRKAAALHNQHKLLGSHWQEEGEVGDLEQDAVQHPLNGDADGQVRWQSLLSSRPLRLVPSLKIHLLQCLQRAEGIASAMCSLQRGCFLFQSTVKGSVPPAGQ